MRRNGGARVALVAISVLALCGTAIGADNNIGTWKLNLAKSTHSPGPLPKSNTVKIEAWGDDGVKYAADGVGADGKPTHAEFQATYDGKEYAFKGNPAHTLAYKRIDANTVQATTKMNGKVTITGTITVSADGKTRTVVQTGTNSHGHSVNNSHVFDKQ